MIVYRIINKINNKKYIGQTKDSIENRFAQHINNSASRSAIARAIIKYGKDNFYIEELAKADSQDQLDQLEKLYIQLNCSMAPYGYNLKTGGLEGSRYSEESIRKMSEAKKGKKLSKKTKDKMSASHLERLKDPELRRFRGQRYKESYWSNEELQEKMSSIRKEYWSDQNHRAAASKLAKQNMTEEQRTLISSKVKESFSRPDVQQRCKAAIDRQKRPVVRSDGQIFASVKEAALASNTSGGTIIKQIKGRYKTAGGFTFCYVNVNDSIRTSSTKQTIYLLIGAPASGKSWVSSHLLDKFEYISYDGNSKKTHLDLLRAPSDKPKLYDPTFKISTVIRRHSDEFNFIIVAIQEDENTLRNRMQQRGGNWTDTIMKRNEQVRKRYEKYGNGGFIGSSSECLDYLKSIV